MLKRRGFRFSSRDICPELKSSKQEFICGCWSSLFSLFFYRNQTGSLFPFICLTPGNRYQVYHNCTFENNLDVENRTISTRKLFCFSKYSYFVPYGNKKSHISFFGCRSNLQESLSIPFRGSSSYLPRMN